MNLSLSARAAVVASLLLSVSMAATAAQPAGGEIRDRNGEATWTGGPFYAPNPATTLGVVKQVPCDVGQPACDVYRLTVSANSVRQVLIAIAPATGFESDDYDLHVYDDKGNRIASDGGEDGYESVVINIGSSAYYDVRVQPWLVGAGSSYSGVAQPSRGEPVDTVRECLEAIPGRMSHCRFSTRISASSSQSCCFWTGRRPQSRSNSWPALLSRIGLSTSISFW